jgi:hypothetical protein
LLKGQKKESAVLVEQGGIGIGVRSICVCERFVIRIPEPIPEELKILS